MAQYIITNRQEPVEFEIPPEAWVQRAIQNAKNLLMTEMGEIPYDRLRGFDPAVYHLPIDRLRMALMPEIDRIFLWEPDVEAVSAEAERVENDELLIRAVIQIGE